jgi:hypothetical protein
MATERVRPQEISNAPPAATTFSWRREIAMWVAIVAAIAVPQVLMGWYSGRGLRPLHLAGLIFWLSAALALGGWRRWRRARGEEVATSRWRFSTGELMLLFTGAILWIGFSAADYQQSQRAQQERERMQARAAEVLGVEGRLGFDSDGSISITVCDRSFDDKRLRSLAALIREWNAESRVRRLMFGSGIKTQGTQPNWAGVTDQSIDLILRWNGLEWLFIEGTAISPAGREKLLTLPDLNDFTRDSIDK